MNRIVIAATLAAAAVAGNAAAATPAATATGDTLLIERVQREDSTALPARGMTMAQVQARYGEPVLKLEPRGGQKADWPVIHRWTYAGFTVYFERDRVIDAVGNKASPGEIGPKPPIR